MRPLIAVRSLQAVLFQSRQQTILIVSPRQDIVETLIGALAPCGYRVAAFASAPAARHWLAEYQPNVVVATAGQRPVQELATLRETCSGGSGVRPLIFVVAPDADGRDQARTLIAHGADDVLFTPLDTEIFLARLEVHLHYYRTLVQLQGRNDLLARLAAFDELTRLYNRRSFLEALTSTLERAEQRATPLAVLLLDIDHFKLINDTYGHHVGDAALRELALRLAAPLRQNDIIGRYGGEEFSVLVHNITYEQAQIVADRLRKSVGSTPLAVEGRLISVTTSVGLAWTAGRSAPTGEQLLRCADSALYEAKRNGRNRTACRKLENFSAEQCDLRRVQDAQPSDTPLPK